MGVGGEHHAPAALPSGKDPVPIVQKGWVGPRADLDGCGYTFEAQFLFYVLQFLRLVGKTPCLRNVFMGFGRMSEQTQTISCAEITEGFSL